MMTGAIIVILAMASQSTATGVPPAASPADLQAATKQVKRATLNDLGALRYSPGDDLTKEMIAVGLSDPDSDVRLSATYALAGRAAVGRFKAFKSSSRMLGVSSSERPLLMQLRPKVLQLLTDSSARVRQGAVIALVNVEYDAGVDFNDVTLKGDAVDALSRQFRHETEPAVRAEIVKTFTLTSLVSPGRDEILLFGLRDVDATIVQFSVMGLARSRPAAALSAIAGLLSHPDRVVRLQVGPALAAYGRAARPYLNDLVRASATENDTDVRRALDAAIVTIQSASRE